MWLRSLETAPEPLNRGQWWALTGASILAAISRIFALARTPWDWDELLFMRALDHFDVATHRPHPPGFPLFIGAAKIVRALGAGDFHALQILNFIAAIAIVPAMFFLCRELRMRFWDSLAAAMLLAFLPNVWLYGGGGFSDVPSMTLIIVAMALLFAGCRSDSAYLAGSLMFAIAIGFRPQNLLVGAVPFLIASRFRRKAVIATAILTVTIVVASSYGVAAWLTGWDRYRDALQAHRQYIARVDSFRSPTRPPLWRVFVDFFVMPYRAKVISAILTLLALIGIVRHRPPVLLALAAFGPLSIFSWLMLDHFSASRFSIGYAPMIAILATEGFVLFVPFVVILCLVWTWPALTQLRNEISPPVAAVQAIRAHVDPRGATIYTDGAMVPFAQWYLPNYDLQDVADAKPQAMWSPGHRAYWLHEAGTTPPHRRLWDIARQRYFEVTVRPVSELVVFGDGWYEEEGGGGRTWRWMGRHSVATLPAVSGPVRLTLQLYVPLDALTGPPNITIHLNGLIIDRFRATSSDIIREIDTKAAPPNTLTIDTDRVATPASDPRELGVRLNAIKCTTAT